MEQKRKSIAPGYRRGDLVPLAQLLCRACGKRQSMTLTERDNLPRFNGQPVCCSEKK